MKLLPATSNENMVKENYGTHMRKKNVFFSISQGNPHMLCSFS
jgi:hypothetical protein